MVITENVNHKNEFSLISVWCLIENDNSNSSVQLQPAQETAASNEADYSKYLNDDDLSIAVETNVYTDEALLDDLQSST